MMLPLRGLVFTQSMIVQKLETQYWFRVVVIQYCSHIVEFKVSENGQKVIDVVLFEHVEWMNDTFFLLWWCCKEWKCYSCVLFLVPVEWSVSKFVNWWFGKHFCLDVMKGLYWPGKVWEYSKSTEFSPCLNFLYAGCCNRPIWYRWAAGVGLLTSNKTPVSYIGLLNDMKTCQRDICVLCKAKCPCLPVLISQGCDLAEALW